MACTSSWFRRRDLLFAAVASAAIAACAAPGKSAAALRLSAPQADLDADVFVDGNYVGQVQVLSDPGRGTVRLAPGVHRLEVRKPGRFPMQRTITVERPAQPEIHVPVELLEDPV